MPTALLTRDRSLLDAFLSRVQGRGDVSPLQADAIRKGWNADNPTSLPLDESEAIQGMTDDALHSAALVLLALAPGGKKVKDASLQTALEMIAAWRLRQLMAAHEAAQDEFENDVMGFTRPGLITGWHRWMIALVIGHLAQQAILGNHGRLTPTDVDRLDRTARRETRYLLRFADDVALAALSGKPLSEKAIVSRSEMYAGVGRAEFYQGIERHPELWPRPRTEAPDENLVDGWVAEFVALDDESTCDPCHDAQGFYPVSTGPFPGLVCLGRSRCRCRRVLRYLPRIYAQLEKV
jgi:hypothetical protein